jgi:molybdopterin-guanine dinucleotide biosynthesis protein A
MQPSPHLAALILAGGQSTRMGTDKARQQWRGVPLLRQVYDRISPLAAPVYCLTPWPERYADLLPSTCIFLPEPQPGQGPAVALGNAIAQLTPPPPWLLVTACDLPCLNPTLLQTWADQLPPLPPDILAAIPYHEDTASWEPLCGFYRGTIGPTLQAYLAQGGRSLQGLLAPMPVQPLPIAKGDRASFHNCNTPQDLKISPDSHRQRFKRDALIIPPREG